MDALINVKFYFSQTVAYFVVSYVLGIAIFAEMIPQR